LADIIIFIGKSYGEIASQSRSQHESQGFGNAAQRGESLEYFSTTEGDTPRLSLLDGVNATWERVSGANFIQPKIDSILAQYNFEHPEYSIESLTALYKMMLAMPSSYWIKQKLNELSNIIIECSGIFAEATANTEYAVTDGNLDINFLSTSATMHMYRLSIYN